MAEDFVIEMLHITKEFPGIKANDDITLQLRKGEVHALLGENGAGKTTLLKILCGVNRADSGTVALLDGAPTDPAARAGIGVVFEDAFFYESFTAAQVGRSLAGVFRARWRDEAFAAYLRRFGLDAGKKLKEYSRGMRLKLSLAAALAHDPELLVLDEPVTGLDPAAAQDLYRTLDYLNKKEGIAIIMVTHDLHSALPYATAILHAGHGSWFYGDTASYLASPCGKRFGGEV